MQLRPPQIPRGLPCKW